MVSMNVLAAAIGQVLGSPLHPTHASMGGGVWTPARWFLANEQGIWLDPSDFSTLFQDSAGTTPVTAVGHVVGRILDKSGRGNHAIQTTAAARPVLQQDGSGKYYLAFDGVDDFLQTGNIDFTGTDKMTVVAGAQWSGGTGMLVELGAGSLVDGVMFLVSSTDFLPGWVVFATGSEPLSFDHMGIFEAATPDTAVLGITHDISGDLSRIRRNGVVGIDGAYDKGTGNFGNYPLYIGCRAGTSLPFNGHLYQLVVRGALTADLAPAESFTADKTGITLP